MPYERIRRQVAPYCMAAWRRYIVDDLESHLHCGRRSTILLCESPHTSEVIEGYPLAGTAGTRVARAFLGTDGRSIGEILHSWRLLPLYSTLRYLGVMNVCRLPMQRKPYCQSLQSSPAFKHLSTIRNGPSASSRLNPAAQKIEEDIRQDLCRRIKIVKECIPGVKFVVCGDVAKAFGQKAGLCGCDIMDCVPHPSTSRRRSDPTRRSVPWGEIEKVKCMVEACRRRARG